MSTRRAQDWNPESDAVQRDQVAAYDEMREACPVAYSELMGWSVFRHADVLRVLHDPETFSNAVSNHISIPNGLDPPEHTEFRQVIEPYFHPRPMADFEAPCRTAVTARIDALRPGKDVEFMAEAAQPFAAAVQCAFLGWPEDMHEPLQRWVLCNQAATFDQDRQTLAALADEFAGRVGELVQARRKAETPADADVTASLMHERVYGRSLSDEELTSILRNWTAGEVGTIAASAGILVHFLATHMEIQRKLREEPAWMSAAIEEILRIHGPLVANRRVVKRPVEIQGRHIDAGERIALMWVAANRDWRVFEEPATFRWNRDQSGNLLYGAGIHACPGAPLARLELRILLERLLQQTAHLEPVPDHAPTNARYPASGFARLPIRITWE